MAQPVVQSGDSLHVTAAAGLVTVGVPYIHGDFFGLPNDTITAAATDRAVVLDLTGVWELDKSTTPAFAEGAPVYWDEDSAECALVGRFIGHCATVGGVLAAATSMRVRIDPRAHVNTGGGGVVKYTLDATAGTPIGTYYGPSLPDDAIVVRSWYEVQTTFTSATDAGTIAFGVETSDVAGLLAAVAIGTGTSFDAGVREGIQVGTAATFGVKTTADGQRLQIDVAVEALTAGVLVLVAQYEVTS